MNKKKLLSWIVLLLIVQVVCLADIGDVNIDGVADCIDAHLIDEYLAGTNNLSYEEAADVNLDGIIDASDSMALRLCSRLPGDVDGDNDIDTNDLKDLITEFDQHSMIECNPAKDANEDGAITYADLIALVRLVYKTGDVNCDGFVDIVDALLTAQYYVGLIPSLPICP